MIRVQLRRSGGWTRYAKYLDIPPHRGDRYPQAPGRVDEADVVAQAAERRAEQAARRLIELGNALAVERAARLRTEAASRPADSGPLGTTGAGVVRRVTSCVRTGFE